MLRQMLYATAALATLGGGAAFAAEDPQPRTLVAIVNRERPESGLSRQELVQIYRGEIRYWPANRQLIQFALPPGSAEARNDFIRKVLQMTPSDFDREWRGKRFRGEAAVIPNPDLSRTEVMQAVATQPHFIAVVELDWLRSIEARFTQDVKVLAIDGKAPEATDYPLRLADLATPADPMLALAGRVAGVFQAGARAMSALRAR